VPVSIWSSETFRRRIRTLLFLLSVSLPAVAETQSGFACDTLVVSGNPEYPPLLWQSDQAPGRLIGAVPALLREIVEPLGG